MEFAGGIDLVGHPSRKLLAETPYCEVDNPLKTQRAVRELFANCSLKNI
ncbi:MAG: hypothetical protein IJW64_05430 [Clostridia bacterium]|nr:hypothetical protein [Clostridia bacterium]